MVSFSVGTVRGRFSAEVWGFGCFKWSSRWLEGARILKGASVYIIISIGGDEIFDGMDAFSGTRKKLGIALVPCIFLPPNLITCQGHCFTLSGS